LVGSDRCAKAEIAARAVNAHKKNIHKKTQKITINAT